MSETKKRGCRVGDNSPRRGKDQSGANKAIMLVIILCLGCFCSVQWRVGWTTAEEILPDVDDMMDVSEGVSDEDEMSILEKVIEEEESKDGGEDFSNVASSEDARELSSQEEFSIDEELENIDTSEFESKGAFQLEPTAKIEEQTDDFVLDDDDLGIPGEDETQSADSSQTNTKSEDFASEGELDSGGDFADVPQVQEERDLAVDPGVQNEIVNLEFKMEGTGSRIVVTARNPLRYREVKNPQMKQVVYFFDNTIAPEKVQRAYDTTEFQSPVALFTLLQIPNETPALSKLIVQLREDQEPSVVPTERGLFIDFGAPTQAVEPRLLYGKEEQGFGKETNVYAMDQKFTGRIIRRLEIKDSDIQDVLRLIAKTSGYNIVVGDDVKGKVGTLSLENVPWDQAFTLILQTKKLGYVKQGSVLRVAKLNTLQQEKGEAMANEKARIQVEPLKTVLIPISYAKAKDLTNKGKPFLTSRGTIDTDERTNTVIVKDIQKSLTQIQKLFGALDTQPPRVSIGAKFVEMSNSFTRSLGTSLGFTGASFAGLNVTHSYDFNATGAVNTIIGAPSLANLEATIKIGESESEVKTLANPTISVVANQKGQVTQASTIFCPVIEHGATGSTWTYRQISSALKLEVTPIVSGDGSIFLTLKIVNEIPTDCRAPIVQARNVDTQVMLENGDTAVIGSVFKSTKNSGINQFPFLGRIPILGFFFSSTTESDEMNEIFVFVTAKIMNPEEAFNRTL